MRRSSLLVLSLLLVALPGVVAAADQAPITDRHFALDLYSGAVLGSSRIVSMGGTGIAIAEGSAYTLQNAAAAAVRPANSQGKWDWDWHLDWLTPSIGSDFDNNGDPLASVGHAVLLTGGLVGQYGDWGVALNGSILQDTIALEGAARASRTTSAQAKWMVAKGFRERQLTVGLGLKLASFELLDASGKRLFSIAGAGLEAGALWAPKAASYRLGASLSFPLSGTQPDVSGCDPNDCEGLILPEGIQVPAQLGLGVAYRFGPTAWNQQVDTRWRDEKALTLAADLLVSGAVPNGYGLEAFLQGDLQRSGAETSLSPRVGAEYEWIPGWLRLRAGSYWEPGRFEGVGGRLHGTFGVEGRIFAFSLFGSPYRLRLGLTLDGASGYGNGALSIGFW